MEPDEEPPIPEGVIRLYNKIGERVIKWPTGGIPIPDSAVLSMQFTMQPVGLCNAFGTCNAIENSATHYARPPPRAQFASQKPNQLKPEPRLGLQGLYYYSESE